MLTFSSNKPLKNTWKKLQYSTHESKNKKVDGYI